MRVIPEAVRKIVARLFVETVRVLVEAVIKIIQAVRLFVEAVRVLVEAVDSLKRVERACKGRESRQSAFRGRCE